jgi:nucleotide-binding universal stress UspA family protein
MAAQTGGGSDGEPPPAPDGVSAFVARVLDQLALSAWLPAALLTVSTTLLLQLRAQRSANLAEALAAVTGDKLRLLILTIPTLVLATLVTQAFSFEAIRTLEGYWRRRGPAAVLRSLLRWHVRRRATLDKRRRDAAKRAFAVARARLLAAGNSHAIVNALESQVLGPPPADLSVEEADKLLRMSWRTRYNAWDLAVVDHLTQQWEDYPAESRVLPTKLGNFMRATEDSLRNAGEDVEGFALRRRGKVAPRVQIQHDQFRTRLDMYCTMVFVGGLLAILGAALLAGRVPLVWTTACTAGFLALSAASYGAAIASARGYGAVLKQMDQAP